MTLSYTSKATQSLFPVSGLSAGQYSLSYLTYVIRCNQQSACNHTVYTTCTQWLHHPSLYILAPWIHECLHFVVLYPDLTLYDAFCCLYTTFFRLWFPKKKNYTPSGKKKKSIVMIVMLRKATKVHVYL